MALEQLFERQPEWIGKMTFLQIAAPSRGTLPAYQQLHQECMAFVDAFNEKYGRGGYKPIIMLAEHHTQEASTPSIAPPTPASSAACMTA